MTDGPQRDDDPGEPSTGLPRIGVVEHEAELLQYLAHGKTVLEIGTGLGTATRALAKTAVTVDTVDIDPWVHTNIHGELRTLDNVRCHHRVPPGLTWDLVFVDGDHRPEAVKRDLALCPLVCPQGMWIFHDATELRKLLPAADGWTIIPTRYGIGIRFCSAKET